MADAGAAEIKSLLDTPSASLAELMIALATALSQAQQDDNATVPSSTFSTINALRTYYRNLGNSVRSIRTSSSAKGQVLEALTQLEAGLASLSKGLREGTSDDATADLTVAQQQSAQANQQLARASSALS
jgi:hypothetical protein